MSCPAPAGYCCFSDAPGRASAGHRGHGGRTPWRRNMSPHPGPAGRPLRVLAVDDHPDVVLTLAALLRRSGHEVMAWTDAPAALAAAPGFCPDVAVIDIGLPGLDG